MQEYRKEGMQECRKVAMYECNIQECRNVGCFFGFIWFFLVSLSFFCLFFLLFFSWCFLFFLGFSWFFLVFLGFTWFFLGFFLIVNLDFSWVFLVFLCFSSVLWFFLFVLGFFLLFLGFSQIFLDFLSFSWFFLVFNDFQGLCISTIWVIFLSDMDGDFQIKRILPKVTEKELTFYYFGVSSHYPATIQVFCTVKLCVFETGGR